MRLRPIAALSAATVTAFLLAGCATGEAAAPEPSGTPASLCDAVAPSGAASDSVTVDGAAGEPSTATFELPAAPEELQSSVVTEGEGDALQAGDFVEYAMTAYNGETGDEILTAGYEPGELMPTQISPDSLLGQVFGCANIGTRVAVAFPSSDTAGSEIYVLDVLDVTPLAAWGEPQEPVDGLPAVEVAEDGTPTITVPDAAPLAETQVEVLKKGDGYEVQKGDGVLIQYRGARWSTGEVFDGGDTWGDKTPYAAATTGFVPGFQKALEGQTVGSQVLVVITPEDGYGAGEINETDLKGETLVFVVDILGAQNAPEAPATE